MHLRAGGMRYSETVTGKGLFRIRETHIRDHYGPLLKAHARDAVVLDLLLRGVAFYREDLGNRRHGPGYVRWDYYYEDLFDLIRDPAAFRGGPGSRLPIDERTERSRKREAIRQNLKRLENLGLVNVDRSRGQRPLIHVLSDAGNGGPFDDPDGHDGRTYVSVLGELFQTGVLARWNTPRLAGYFCAMIGQRHDDRQTPAGQGSWWRTPEWFTGKYRRDENVLMPFADRTIREGLTLLAADGHLEVTTIYRNPKTRRPLKGGRNHYTNRFIAASIAAKDLSDQAEQLLTEASLGGEAGSALASQEASAVEV